MKLQNVSNLNFKAAYIGGKFEKDRRQEAKKIAKIESPEARKQIVRCLNDVYARLTNVPGEYAVRFCDSLYLDSRRVAGVSVWDLSDNREIANCDFHIADKWKEIDKDDVLIKNINKAFDGLVEKLHLTFNSSSKERCSEEVEDIFNLLA